ncbi:MAG: condensation domain-containing protein [Calditrichia bacterium]
MDVKNEFVAPETLIQEKLVRIWQEVLGIGKVGIRDNFFELGGDSILSIQIISRANQVGFALTAKDIFQHPTIEGLASLEGKSRDIHAEQGPVSGDVPLTPIQHWFFEQNLEEAHHYNQSVFLEIMQPLDPEILKTVTGHLIIHHDALRLRFKQTDAGWEQNHADVNGRVPFEYFDFSDSSPSEMRDKIENATAAIQAGLNFMDGPIFRIACFYLGPNKSHRLLIAIHHLVMDAVSWRVLLEDFQNAYQQVSEGKPVNLPMKTTSFRYWAERINEYAKSAELAAEKKFWLNQLSQETLHIPKDMPEAINTEGSARSITVALNEEETHILLQKIPAVYHTEINDVLLSALLKTVTDRYHGTNLLIDLESHGREEMWNDIDLSRTVGWFTNLYPVLLVREANQMEEIIFSVRDQLKNIPRGGIGYGILRYLSKEWEFREQIKKLTRPEIIFNYLGQFEGGSQENAILRTATESSGHERSPRSIRSHLIEINGAVGHGRLQMEWSYSENIHCQQTIQEMADLFILELHDFITRCENMDAGVYPGTDFSEFGWNKEDLDDIISTIENSDE